MAAGPGRRVMPGQARPCRATRPRESWSAEKRWSMCSITGPATGQMLDARIGSSPLNGVTIGLAQLGQPVTFFRLAGSRLWSERLAQALRRRAVNTSAAQSRCELHHTGPGRARYPGAWPTMTLWPRQRHASSCQPTWIGCRRLSLRVLCDGGSGRPAARCATGTTRIVARMVSYDVNVPAQCGAGSALAGSGCRAMLPHVHLLRSSSDGTWGGCAPGPTDRLHKGGCASPALVV